MSSTRLPDGHPTFAWAFALSCMCTFFPCIFHTYSWLPCRPIHLSPNSPGPSDVLNSLARHYVVQVAFGRMGVPMSYTRCPRFTSLVHFSHCVTHRVCPICTWSPSHLPLGCAHNTPIVVLQFIFPFFSTLCGHGQSWANLTSFVQTPLSNFGRPTNLSHTCFDIPNMRCPMGAWAHPRCENSPYYENKSTQIIISSMTTKYYHLLVHPCYIINQL